MSTGFFLNHDQKTAGFYDAVCPNRDFYDWCDGYDGWLLHCHDE